MIDNFPCRNCNECININITEEEQHSSKNKSFHYCNKYGARVIHRSTDIGFHSFIYPCNRCVSDKYENFKRRSNE